MPGPTIDGQSIRTAIKSWFDDVYGKVPYEIRLDIGDQRTYYQTFSPEEARAILEGEPRVARRLYRRNHFDCEDFAIASRAAISFAHYQNPQAKHSPPLAFGMVFANSHATNIGIDHGGQPYIFDWYYDVVWRGDLKVVLEDEIGGGWLSPRSVRYILI